MSVFRASARSALVLVALSTAAVIASSTAALAQSREPLRLGPPLSGSDSGSRRPEGGWAPVRPGLGDPVRPSRPDRGPVEEEKLEPLDRDSVGTLEPGRSLGTRLWEKSRRDDITALLGSLPAQIDSIVLHDLMRRLLLTGAPLPQAGGEGPSVLALRAADLASIGAVDDAAALLHTGGSKDRDESVARLELELALLQYDLSAACPAAQAGIATYTDAFWQKVLTFCQAQAGERDRAALGAALLRDNNQNDPVFFGLLEIVLGNDQAKMPAIEQASPLILAMLRAASKPVPPSLLASAKPALLRSIALSPAADLDLRLETAERAVMVHALDPKILADLYRRVETRPGETQALGETAPADTARQRALLFQGAAKENDPAARAGALRRFFASVQDRRIYPAMLLMAQPLIEPMQPGGRLDFFAEDAVRAMLLARRQARAREWAAIAEREAGGNSRATAAVTALAPLLALAEPDKRSWSEDAINDWWDLMTERSAARAPKQAALVLSMLDALDEPVPQRLWNRLRDAGLQRSALPPAKIWEGMLAAAAEGRRGETVLYALTAAGGEDALKNPAIMHGVIRALRQIGLEADARALAVEAAIVAGV